MTILTKNQKLDSGENIKNRGVQSSWWTWLIKKEKNTFIFKQKVIAFVKLKKCTLSENMTTNVSQKVLIRWYCSPSKNRQKTEKNKKQMKVECQ